MADDDDWETDPDFENTMTEEQKRKAGNPDLLAKQKEEGVGHITMDSIQNKKLAESQRPKDQLDRAAGYQQPGVDQTTEKK